MPPLRRVLLLATTSALALAGCTPAADVPPAEIRSAADAARAVDGVLAVAITRTTVIEPVAPNFGEREEAVPSSVYARVLLDGSLDAAAAGEAAGETQRLLSAGAGRLDPDEKIEVSIDLTVGPTDPGHAADDRSWLEVRTEPGVSPDVVTDATADGYTLHADGATYVGLAFGADSGARTAEPFGSRAGVVAASPDDLIGLARTALALDRGVHLSAPGVRYEPSPGAPDLSAVRLVTAAAALPGARDVAFLGEQRLLTVQSDADATAQSLADLRRWLEAHDFATTDDPLAYTVTDAAYAETTGWVSGAEPASYAPHTLDPFTDAEPWAEDPAAPGCTGRDLEVTFGVVDSAAGTRGGSVLATNVSGGPCAVEHVPGLVFENEAGQPQQGITVEPYEPGVVPGRVVVPDGGTVLAPLLWRAMSTANDPDTTTTVQVTAVPGAEPVPLDVTTDGTPATGLDVLDGAEVRVGPWTQGD